MTKQIKIYHRPCWFSSYKEVVAEGNTLKEACLDWESERTSDNLWNAFKKSSLYVEENGNNDNEVNEAYANFIGDLTGEQMFELMRDGQYHWFEEVL